MPVSNNSTSATGIDSVSLIAEWVEKRTWQSAALRIIVENGIVTEKDIKDLAAMLCRSNGVNLPFGSTTDLPLVSKNQIASLNSSGRLVVLKSIRNLKNVNSIQDGSKIEFADKGITLIYGENGSGKTGYSRLLRNACSARAGMAKVLPNVFCEADTGTPSATFNAEIDGDDQAYDWAVAADSNIPYPEVMVYDGEGGRIEISKQNDVSYIPPIMNALDELTSCIGDVKASIESYAHSLDSIIESLMIPEQIQGAQVVNSFFALQSYEKREAQLDSLKPSEADLRRIENLTSILSKDPTKEMDKLQRNKSQLLSLKTDLGEMYKVTSPSYCGNLESARKGLISAREASDLAAKAMEGNGLLPGTGSDTWKTLWEAARVYSDSVAYPGHTFPHLPEEGLCPLCQTPLSEDAKHRFSAFDTYVASATERLLKEREKTANTFKTNFENASKRVCARRDIAELMVDEQARQKLSSLIDELNQLTELPAINKLEKICGEVTDIGSLVKAEIEAIEKALEEMQKSFDPAMNEKFKSELRNLQARQWMLSNNASILAQAKNVDLRNKLNSITSDCNTSSLTRLVAKVADREVSEGLKNAFVNELSSLGFESNHVEIETNSKKGKELQAMRFTGKGSGASLTDVLSEGEQKVISIAGFFANVDMHNTLSTIVFDDPVTSLDHRWRKRIALRLSEESKERPVVIFTHDFVFASDLIAAAEENGTEVFMETVEKVAGNCGVCIDGIPWNSMRIKQRIKVLNEQGSMLQIVNKEEGNEQYRRKTSECYSLLRSAWEKCVEELLLNETVMRFRPSIETQRLKKLTDITDDDIAIVNREMGKCSAITEAHNTPNYSPDPAPTPEEYIDDVAVLDEWSTQLRKRRNH